VSGSWSAPLRWCGVLGICGLCGLSAQAASDFTQATWFPKGFKLVETLRGDLNKDGQPDIVLLVQGTDPAAVVQNRFGERVDRNRRGLVIALRQGDGYTLALKNLTCFASENEDGGVYVPPELNLELAKGSLLINFLHGRYGYWSYNFRYRQGSFELIGYDSSQNHGPVVERVTSINLLTNKVLTRVNTNPEAEGGDERYKETWSKVQRPKVITLSGISGFEDFSLRSELGLTESP
jgi:hypothetical protein